ncbi:hypothetical protein CL653_01040 [bacterium]|nr:hypothetical protein [bacterium]
MSSVSRRLLMPPNYLLLPCIGIDVSDTSLKYVQFSAHYNNLKLEAWGDVPIPEGVLSQGNIADSKGLAKVMGEVKKRTGVSLVRMSLPEEKAYLFETTVEYGTPYKEIRGNLEFHLEENIPIPLEEALFDYQIIESDKEGEPMRVAVSAYTRATINSYYEVARAVDMHPLSFEVEAQAIARAVLSPDDEDTHMVLDFGKSRTGIGIVHKGSLLYTSTIDLGGKELSTALRRQLGDRDEDELTDIKNTLGLVRTFEDTSAYDAMITTMSAIKDEVAVRIEYWNSRINMKGSTEHEIKTIILCGGSCNLKGLPEYLNQTLGVEVQRGNVWQNAFDLNDYIPPIDKNHSYGYATAIGLAMTNFKYHD